MKVWFGLAAVDAGGEQRQRAVVARRQGDGLPGGADDVGGPGGAEVEGGGRRTVRLVPSRLDENASPSPSSPPAEGRPVRPRSPSG